MKTWTLLLAILAVSLASGLVIGTPSSNAMTRAEFRRHIRATPILARPSRPGHFYGNTVRRRHHG